MNAFAYLCTTSNGSPSINHCTLIYVCADVYIGRHQYHISCDISPVPGYSMWHSTNTQFFKIFFKIHFIIPFKWLHAPRLHLLDAEIKQYRLFNPFIYLPSIFGWFGHPQSSFVYFFNHGFDIVYNSQVGKHFSVLPRLFNRLS